MRVQCPSRGTLPYAPAHEHCQRACCIAAQPSSSCRRPRRRCEHCGPRGLASLTALPALFRATRRRWGEGRVRSRQLVLVATSTAPAACIDLAARLRLARRRSPHSPSPYRARSRRRQGDLACSSLAAALAARVVSLPCVCTFSPDTPTPSLALPHDPLTTATGRLKMRIGMGEENWPETGS